MLIIVIVSFFALKNFGKAEVSPPLGMEYTYGFFTLSVSEDGSL